VLQQEQNLDEQKPAGLAMKGSTNAGREKLASTSLQVHQMREISSYCYHKTI